MSSVTDSDIFGISPRARLIRLRGFSGCPVALIDDGGKSFVRKIARDTAYNTRLLQQADKQKNFPADSHLQPAFLQQTGLLPSGLAFVDMDYIAGITAAETLNLLPLSAIPNWSSLLLRFASAPVQGVVPPQIFYEKIASLRDDLTRHNLCTPAVTQVLEKLSRRAWANIPHSACHGDLTLENILVQEGRLYLIDFLDSFADSWYIDIAKLFQDLIGGWSFRRNEPDRNLLLRMASLRHSMETALEERSPGCIAIIHDLYALHLLRILPYSTSQQERAFVDHRLKEALNTFL